MEVSVKNFGTVVRADVHVGGLTVITGENDTGKSTIGKILFSLVKAIARYEEDLEEAKEVRITEIAEKMYFNLRRFVNVEDHSSLRDFFHPRKIYSQLRLSKDRAIAERMNYLHHFMNTSDIPRALFDSCIRNLEKISSIIEEPDDEFNAINRATKKAFFSEFKGEIINKSTKSPAKAQITITDGVSELIDISWGKDLAQNLKYNDELGYTDATYVDSPAIIQFHHLVKMARTHFDADLPGRGSVPLHVKDLATKIGDSIYTFSMMDFFSDDVKRMDLSSKISSIFGGVLAYDEEKSDFYLERNGYKLSSSNIASGIKSLGVIDLLIKGGAIKPNALLILDEPEVNLHPKWQVDYCEVICELVERGVDVIVNTHSPYIIEALKHFCDQTNIENKFYMALKDERMGTSEFFDITQDISVAIDNLAAPLQKLNKDEFFDF